MNVKLTSHQIRTVAAAAPFWAWLDTLGVDPEIEIIDHPHDGVLVCIGGSLASSLQWERVQICVSADDCTWCGEQSAPRVPDGIRDIFWP